MSDYSVGAAAVSRPGWEWTGRGLDVWTRDQEGQPVRVSLPLEKVIMIFDQETAAVGCPLAPTIGDFSVGGFFKKLGRGIKKFGKKIGSGIKKAAKKVGKVAAKVGKTVYKIGRSKVFRGIVAGVAVAFPVVAPAAAALETANQIADRIEKGKRAVQQLARGVKSGRLDRLAKEGAKAAAAAGGALEKAAAGDRNAAQFATAFMQTTGQMPASGKRPPAARGSARRPVVRRSAPVRRRRSIVTRRTAFGTRRPLAAARRAVARRGFPSRVQRARQVLRRFRAFR